MTETTTVARLTAGDRILADCGEYGEPIPVKDAGNANAEIIVLTADPERRGRKFFVQSDRGAFEAGGATKVLRAVEPAAEDTPLADTDQAPAVVPAFPSAPADDEPETLTASVTVDSAGRLTRFSRLTVGDASAPVPWKVDRVGGAVAPIRLAHTLAEMGYQPAGRWTDGPDGTATCAVVPLETDAA